MFISTFELFKIGIGPSSSHTMGPMLAAYDFSQRCVTALSNHAALPDTAQLRCRLFGSLAHTGRGHATDLAVCLGLHGYRPADLLHVDIAALHTELAAREHLLWDNCRLRFHPADDLLFDTATAPGRHPNALRFSLDCGGEMLLSDTYYSIGGGFIVSDSQPEETQSLHLDSLPHPFTDAKSMLRQAAECGLGIADMMLANEGSRSPAARVGSQLEHIWQAMRSCVERGLASPDTPLPGPLQVRRRAQQLHRSCIADTRGSAHDWLCAYAIAVNEENAAGHMVVTAPTNGAAGVIPAALYYLVSHEGVEVAGRARFLLTAAAIGGLIKRGASISGAEVGCQGEVGSAAAMAAAGLCAVWGGSPAQVEHAAEIALEHHLGMTCDPVAGLVQIPCIERNAFGASKAYTAARLALKGLGEHRMALDNCIRAMRQTGDEMSSKYKETALGGLAVNYPEC